MEFVMVGCLQSLGEKSEVERNIPVNGWEIIGLIYVPMVT